MAAIPFDLTGATQLPPCFNLAATMYTPSPNPASLDPCTNQCLAVAGALVAAITPDGACYCVTNPAPTYFTSATNLCRACQTSAAPTPALCSAPNGNLLFVGGQDGSLLLGPGGAVPAVSSTSSSAIAVDPNPTSTSAVVVVAPTTSSTTTSTPTVAPTTNPNGSGGSAPVVAPVGSSLASSGYVSSFDYSTQGLPSLTVYGITWGAIFGVGILFSSVYAYFVRETGL
ncbi:hypothetical protein HK101_000741 [Irineochytrium annulatum]|nr:hypothetical protein HK101_000741 [Irineochytrium annulatum]